MSFIEFVNNEPTGVAEHILLQDRHSLFAGWRSIQTTTTPVYGFNALGHVENGGYHRPGDGPLLVGMATSGIQAGSNVSNEITYRNTVVGQQQGPGFDADPNAQPTIADAAAAEEEEAIAQLREAGQYQSFLPGSEAETQLIDSYTPDDGAYSFWGAIKGTSRWAFAALDTMFVNSPDAFARTIALNETREAQGLNPLARSDILNLYKGQGSSLALAIPSLAYLTDGSRDNMGSGFFARGDIAEDVQASIDEYDQYVASLSQADWQAAQNASEDGDVWVQGVLGQQIKVNSYNEWIEVQKYAGRARVLDSAIQSSPEQQALGTPYGTLADDIFQDGIYGVDKNGNYYRATTGRFLAQEVAMMDSTTFASKAVSGVLDFGKHLLDFPIFKIGKGVKTVLGIGGNKLAGLSGEAGQLTRASVTVQDAFKWADPDARKGMAADMQKGTVDADRMRNVLSRGSDANLQAAIKTVGTLKAAAQDQPTRAGAKLIETASKEGKTIRVADLPPEMRISADQADQLIRDAEKGNWAARKWAEKTLATVNDDADSVAAQLGNLDDVLRRSDDLSIVDGKLGSSVEHVEDVRMGQIDEEVARLADMLGDGKAGVVLDDKGMPFVTFDADLTRAAETARVLEARVVQEATEKSDLAARYMSLTDELADAVDEGQTFYNALRRTEAEHLGTGPFVGKAVENPLVGRWTTWGARHTTPVWDGYKAMTKTKAGRQIIQRRRQIIAQINEVVDEANSLGHKIDFNDRHKLDHLVRQSDEAKLESAPGALRQNLFNGTWTSRRWAEKQLGDSMDARREVDNLVRVMKRHDTVGDLAANASAWDVRLSPGDLRRLFTGNEGRMRQLLEDIAGATTHEQMWRLLQRTTEHMTSQGINPALIDALVSAKSVDEVADKLIRMSQGEIFIPNRIRLLGDWATKGGAIVNGSTAVGAATGFLSAGTDGDEWSWGDAFGGALFGAAGGRYAGSALVGSAALFRAGTATGRRVEDLSDMMDLMLAGARSSTANQLQLLQRASRKVDLTQQRYDQLTAPQQFGAAFGHLPMGRLLAREAPTKLNINSPSGMYAGLRQYARNFGLRGDEKVHTFKKTIVEGTDAAGNTISRTESLRLVSSDFESAKAFDEAVAKAKTDGFDTVADLDLNEVFSKLSTMQANNTATGWVVLRDFFKVVDETLADAGLPPELRRLATRFTEAGIDDFMANVDQVGTPVNLQQMLVNGGQMNMADAPLLTSELWGGHISLPPPDVMRKAMSQTHTAGRVMGVMTGKGVTANFFKALDEVKKGDETFGSTDWHRVLTPEFERNVMARVARFSTQSLFVPLVLLTRPFAFMSRVLIDDQARMAAAGLGQWTPASPIAWMIGNWKQFQRTFASDGAQISKVPSRSVIPDEIFDPTTGKLADDALDQLTRADLDDGVQQHLRIASKERVKGRKNLVYGSSEWKMVGRDNPKYVEALAREYRQLLRDPMVGRLAQAKTDDPVQEVFDWLMEVNEHGDLVNRRILDDWASQFDDAAEARQFMQPEQLRAFLHDQYARMHYKTGGEWVFIDASGTVRRSDGAVGEQVGNLDKWAQDFAENGPGYRITRKGDNEMLRPLRTKRIGQRPQNEGGEWTLTEGTKVTKNISDEVDDHITEFVRNNNERLEGRFASATPEEVQQGTVHRLPAGVKTAGEREVVGTQTEYAQMLEYLYDLFLGPMSKRLSREPTFASHYWERIGMLLPQMTDDIAEAYLDLARAESPQLADRVEKVAGVFRKAGMDGKHISDFKAVDAQAKAWGVEKLNQTLFDLYEQRNFIDSVRVLAPFMGPMVEAFENWGRVLKRRPHTVWRRGLQGYNMLYDPSPIAQDRSMDRSLETGFGTFYTDPDTGQDMVRYPFTGPMKRWMLGTEGQEGEDSRLEARLAGFNVVFGPTDFRDPDIVDVPGAGVPLPAVNPGLGPAGEKIIGPLLRDKEGAAGQLYDSLFEFGEGEALPTTLIPYHLQRIMERYPATDWLIGEEGVHRFQASVNAQLDGMIGEGLIGDSPDYKYNVNVDGELEAAQEEARGRAAREATVEGFLRGMMPTVSSQSFDPHVQIQMMDEEGLPNATALMPVADIAKEVFDLMSEEGAVWIRMPDGSEVSTEADYEAATEYLNRKYGLNIFSADFMNISKTTTLYTNVMTEGGLSWKRANPQLREGQLRRSGFLLLPDIALAKEEEETDYSFEAREQALEDGDLVWADDPTSQNIKWQERLLGREYDSIDRWADENFGTDDTLNSSERDIKDLAKRHQKEAAKSRFERKNIPVGQRQQIFDSVIGWDDIDWASKDLDPEEQRTVDAVLWYLGVRDEANRLASTKGIGSIALRGDSASDKEFMAALRNDVETMVATQIGMAQQSGLDMGNFVYIYNTYLAAEFDEIDPPDPMEDFLISMYGVDPRGNG